jgi:ActR/RegA family two-component response regulator
MGDAPRILFVDDEDSIRLTLPPLLESYGFEVASAGTVAEALGLITQRKFDVLISDLNIGHPGDGFTVVSAMRRHQPEALRFIVTGYPAFESALEAIREEVHDYLIKPTETEMLVEKIRSKLATRTPDQGILRQRLPQLIRGNKESIVEDWLQAVKQDAEIRSTPIPDLERKEHLPLLLQIATAVAEGKELTAEDTEAYLRHGIDRYRQGYTVPLLIREARLLQASVADCIQRNFNGIEMSYQVPDTIHFMGTIDALLEASVRGFIQQANSDKMSSRRRRNKQKDLAQSNTKAS